MLTEQHTASVTEVEQRGMPRAVFVCVLLCAALALLAGWFFGSIPEAGHLQQALLNAAHFPLFAALAITTPLLLKVVGPPPLARGHRNYIISSLILALLAIGTEALQLLIAERVASLADVTVNLLGAAAGLAGFALWDDDAPRIVRSRAGRMVLLAAVLATTAIIAIPLGVVVSAHAKRAMDFPVLLQFDGRLDQVLITARNAHTSLTRLPPEWSLPEDGNSLRVGLQPGRYSGITVVAPRENWRGYDHLVLDLTNPGAVTLPLTLRINDAEHDERYADRLNHALALAPRTRSRFEIPLDQIRDAPANRQMDLGRISTLILFSTHGSTDLAFHVTRIELR